MTIHSSGQTISSFPHIEGITLRAGEEFTERASGMGLDGIDKAGKGSNEGEAAGVLEAGSLAGMGVRNNLEGTKDFGWL